MMLTFSLCECCCCYYAVAGVVNVAIEVVATISILFLTIGLIFNVVVVVAFVDVAVETLATVHILDAMLKLILLF